MGSQKAEAEAEVNVLLFTIQDKTRRKGVKRRRVSQGMEKVMAPHSSTLAWKIPWTEEPGGLQFVGSLRVGHD